MELQRPLCFFLVLFTLVSISQARKFYVGGSTGWVSNPSENYSEWSGRNRFQINDTLVFKYKKGSDSVLEVKKEDYDKCNKSNPIKKFEEGETEFKFDRTGPFYFISGKEGNCEKGQKLTVVVLSIRGGGGGGQTLTPSPSASPPTGNTPATSPTPVITPPASGPPAPTPAGSPGPAGGPPSPSPVNIPATSPTPAVTPPASSPVTASGPPAPSPAGSPGPVGGPPSPATSPGPLSPGSPLGSAQTPEAAPPPRTNDGASGAPSSFLVYAATVVVSAALLR